MSLPPPSSCVQTNKWIIEFKVATSATLNVLPINAFLKELVNTLNEISILHANPQANNIEESLG